LGGAALQRCDDRHSPTTLVIPNRAAGPVRNPLLTSARAHNEPSPRKTGKGTSSTHADQDQKKETGASARGQCEELRIICVNPSLTVHLTQSIFVASTVWAPTLGSLIWFYQPNMLNLLAMTRRRNGIVYAARNKNQNGKVVCGDAMNFLESLPTGCARVVFLDPPFNLGKKYDKGKSLDKKPEAEYEIWLENIASESARVLEPGGALFLYHLPRWAMRIGTHLDGALVFRQWIAVSMKNGFVRGQRLYPAHYALLMFAKGELKRFTRLRVSPTECRTCGELVKDYGGYTPIIRRKGINLSDIWDDLSPVRHSRTKNRPANELPALLFHRILRMVGGRGALYVDPFAGSGSGVVAAARKGMHFAACDIVSANCGLIARRLQELKGSQKRRRQ
jgi:site-specific DNA-methyltransferase (adenine-specific)